MIFQNRSNGSHISEKQSPRAPGGCFENFYRAFHFLDFNDNLLQKIWPKKPQLYDFWPITTPCGAIFLKFCSLLLKFSYIFSNFATFETIWLILTLRHTFNEEILTISQQNISFLLNFSLL